MLRKFFWMCSGADTDFLKKSSKSEQIKYAGIGGTVFFTALLAAIASAYALYTVFDNMWIATFFGFIWGLMIFNLDRYIVSSMKKHDRKGKEILQATPRIILAIIIALVISKPLELKIFEKEVDRVLLEQKNELTLQNQDQIASIYNVEIQRLEGEIGQLNNSLLTKEAEVDLLYDKFISEAEGTDGTLKIGKGPVYKEKRQKHDQSLSELNTLRSEVFPKIENKEGQINQLRTEQKEKVSETQPVIDGFDGFMARINALNELPMLPQLFILLLFIALETAPVLAKLIAPRGEYDYLLLEHEDRISNLILANRDQRKEFLKAENLLNERAYGQVSEEEEIMQYKRQRARELLQFQSDTFLKNQKDFVGDGAG